MPYLESLRVFVRVVETGSITSGGRDLRLTPAVASNRIKELERRLGVRLLNRTTRNLSPTEVGQIFFDHARRVVDTLEEAEAVVAGFSGNPQGAIRVTAPHGVGRRLVAPLVPRFVERYPDVEIRLHLSDRRVNLLEDRLDVVFFIGDLADSNFKLSKIMDCPRVLCAAPAYLERRGVPQHPDQLMNERHNCLLLRYPRSPEYFWILPTAEGLRKYEVSGSYDSDDGEVLTSWALEGWGIANKPRFEVAEHLRSGALVEVLPDHTPPATPFGCLFAHRKLLDPKIRLFIDHMTDGLAKMLR